MLKFLQEGCQCGKKQCQKIFFVLKGLLEFVFEKICSSNNKDFEGMLFHLEKSDDKSSLDRFFYEFKHAFDLFLRHNLRLSSSEYQKEQIAVLRKQLDLTIIIKKELMRQLSSVNEKNANLIMELNNQQNQLQEITIQQQIDNIDESSIRIELDDAQFQENVQKLNKEQEQTIKKMKALLQEFQQFQSNRQLKLNRDKKIDQLQVQNLINLIKDTISAIIELEQVTIKFKKDLESYLKHENDQVKEKIQDIFKKLEKNTACFNCVKKIFEATVKMLERIESINQELQQDNQILEDQVKSLYDKNIEFENKMSNLLTKINEQTIQENTISIDQDHQLNNKLQDKQQTPSNVGKDSELETRFFQQTWDDINNLVSINLTFFLSWNNTSNFKQKNQELIDSTTKLITNLKTQQIRIGIDIDIIGQELKRILESIEQVYFRFSNNSVVNQYNYQNLQYLLKLFQTLSNYKKEIDRNTSIDDSLIQFN